MNASIQAGSDAAALQTERANFLATLTDQQRAQYDQLRADEAAAIQARASLDPFDLPSDQPPQFVIPEPDAEGFDAWLSMLMRKLNLGLVFALLAKGEPLTTAIYTAILIGRTAPTRNGGGWRRSLADWFDDTGLNRRAFQQARGCAVRHDLMRVTKTPQNVGIYLRDDDAIKQFVYEYGVNAGVDFATIARAARPAGRVRPPAEPRAAVSRYESYKLPKPVRRSVGTDRTNQFVRIVQTHIEKNEVENIKTPLPPCADTVVRKPDEKEKPTPKPKGEKSDRLEAARILTDCCVKRDISHDADQIREFCELRDVTPLEAYETVKAAESTSSTVESWGWVKAVIEGNRRRPAKTGTTATPIGVHASHLPSPALAQIKANEARPKSPPDIAEPALRASLAALKKRASR